jgi:hypothetical protein
MRFYDIKAVLIRIVDYIKIIDIKINRTCKWYPCLMLKVKQPPGLLSG